MFSTLIHYYMDHSSLWKVLFQDTICVCPDLCFIEILFPAAYLSVNSFYKHVLSL